MLHLPEAAVFHWKQPVLLEMVNTRYGRQLFRLPDIPLSERITRILPHMFQVQVGGRQWVSEFHVNPVMANSMRWRWEEFCEYEKWLAERRYNQIAERAVRLGIPASVIRRGLMMATVTTVYPDPHAESTSVDGTCGIEGQDAAFTTVRGGNGTDANDTATSREMVQIKTSTSGDPDYFWNTIRRGLVVWDASGITDSDSVDSAIASLEKSGSSTNGLNGDTHDNSRMVLVESAPGTNTAVVAGDFQTMSATSFGESAKQTDLVSGYNPITLNASGLANISFGAGTVCAFGYRYKWDNIDSVTGLTWASNQRMGIAFNFADQGGTPDTIEDPKLAITHSAAGVGNPWYMYAQQM